MPDAADHDDIVMDDGAARLQLPSRQRVAVRRPVHRTTVAVAVRRFRPRPVVS